MLAVFGGSLDTGATFEARVLYDTSRGFVTPRVGGYDIEGGELLGPTSSPLLSVAAYIDGSLFTPYVGDFDIILIRQGQ